VAGEVPPGYVESGLTGGATVTTSLRVFSCDAMALDNQTIEKGQVFAEVSILVQAPAEAASPDGGDLFMKEFITTSTSLAARLQGLGAPAVVGTVSTTPGPTQAIHVTAPGGVSYDVSGASGDTMGQPVELGLRLHFGPDGLSWLDESGSELAAESTGTGIATTTGGFLGHATQSTGGTASALLFEVPVQGTLAFGKLP
jgi:hypothetical protein